MSDRKSSLVMDLQPGEALVLAGAMVQVIHKSGRVARLRVTAPVDLKIEKVRENGCEGCDQSKTRAAA